MKRYDRIAGIILFSFGLIISIQSFSYPLGSLSLPGARLFPLLASISLMALSMAIVLNTYFKSDRKNGSIVSFFPAKEAPKRLGFAIFSLLAFRYLLPVVGFGPTTFLFIFFLGRYLAHYNLKICILLSLTTAFLSYFLFQVLLSITLPG